MKYQQLSSGSSYPYPDHNIDPKKKGKDFCMQYARAAYSDFSFGIPKGIFYNNGGDYEKFNMYAMGAQPITPYKTIMGVDSETNNTWLSNSWQIRPIGVTYIDKLVARVLSKKHDIIATPIDITAQSELQEYYAQIKAKLALRQAMQQQSPELANHPLLSLQSGEPMDNEELEMRVELGEQFNRAKDAEMAIAVGFHENNIDLVEQQWARQLVINGVTGYEEWLGEDNKAKFDNVDPGSLIVSKCKKKDFSDAVHVGRIMDVSLVDLATKTNPDGTPCFTDDELQEFASSIAGKFGNPGTLGHGRSILNTYDKFKCKVLNIYFYSYDDYVFNNAVDENGNADFRKAEYGRGKQSTKYIRKKIKCIYKAKWVIGTEKCYEYGLLNDMKRSSDPKKLAETTLPIKLISYNFYEMMAKGMVERLIPYIDDYQITMMKIENFKNRSVPSGWWMDLDSLENAAMNKGGKNMTPQELIQMFMETGVLVGRSRTADGQPLFQNSQPIIPINNTAASELAMFYQDLVNLMGAMEKIIGYNDITTGNPEPKTLTPGYELANQSTQDSISAIVEAMKTLKTNLADDVLMRMKQGVKRSGELSGYGKALNTNTVQFMRISPTISLRDYGIMLEEKTSDEQKQWLYQMMQGDIANGFLDSSDAVYLANTFNAKQAQMIWAHRVKKAKERMQQYELQKMQAQGDANAKTVQAAEQAKQQTVQMEYQFELQKQAMLLEAELKKKEMEVQGELQKEQMRLQVQYQMNVESNSTKAYVADTTAEAKVLAQHLDNHADVVTTHMANEGAIEKQKEANKKPQPKSKK